MNPYEELDISINADDEEIKLKFRSLAQIHHPDKGGDEEIFKRIKEAYEILIDPIRRKEFDLLGDSDSSLAIRNAALDHIAQMLNSIVPTMNPEQDDLITIMNNQITQIKVDMHHNIRTCDSYIEHLQKVLRRLNSNKKKNIMIEIVERQLEQRKFELKNFNDRIKICDLESEILKDYSYGLQELVSLPSIETGPS